MAQTQHVDTLNPETVQFFHPASAHAAFVAAIIANTPDPIGPTGDADDVDARYQHVDAIMAAVEAYVGGIVRDTAASLPCGTLDDGDAIKLLGDCRSDVVGAMFDAACAMWRREPGVRAA